MDIEAELTNLDCFLFVQIDRIMEKFAERFTEQNPGLFPTADVAFILSFSTH